MTIEIKDRRLAITETEIPATVRALKMLSLLTLGKFANARDSSDENLATVETLPAEEDVVLENVSVLRVSSQTGTVKLVEGKVVNKNGSKNVINVIMVVAENGLGESLYRIAIPRYTYQLPDEKFLACIHADGKLPDNYGANDLLALVYILVEGKSIPIK